MYSIFKVYDYKGGELSTSLNLEEERFFEEFLEIIFEDVDYDDDEDEDSDEDDSDNQTNDKITKDSDINVVVKYLEDLYQNSGSEYAGGGTCYECFKHVDGKLVSNFFNAEFWLKLAKYYKEKYV